MSCGRRQPTAGLTTRTRNERCVTDEVSSIIILCYEADHGAVCAAGAQAGALGGTAPARGLQQVQGLLSFFEVRREAAADASAAGYAPDCLLPETAQKEYPADHILT